MLEPVPGLGLIAAATAAWAISLAGMGESQAYYRNGELLGWAQRDCRGVLTQGGIATCLGCGIRPHAVSLEALSRMERTQRAPAPHARADRPLKIPDRAPRKGNR